jgi:hypothetical protein
LYLVFKSKFHKEVRLWVIVFLNVLWQQACVLSSFRNVSLVGYSFCLCFIRYVFCLYLDGCPDMSLNCKFYVLCSASWHLSPQTVCIFTSPPHLELSKLALCYFRISKKVFTLL